jgi:hypothetical protein
MPDHLIAGEVMAVAYSGFREGQQPDRGDGAQTTGRRQPGTQWGHFLLDAHRRCSL